MLVLEGESVGAYYERVVRADWRGGTWRVSLGVLLVCVLAVLAAGSVARRLRFGAGRD